MKPMEKELCELQEMIEDASCLLASIWTKVRVVRKNQEPRPRRSGRSEGNVIFADFGRKAVQSVQKVRKSKK